MIILNVIEDNSQAWMLDEEENECGCYYHREGEPAIMSWDGFESWYLHGKRHRDDGPATTYPQGWQVWYYHGIKRG